jgi:hypothetical protein
MIAGRIFPCNAFHPPEQGDLSFRRVKAIAGEINGFRKSFKIVIVRAGTESSFYY